MLDAGLYFTLFSRNESILTQHNTDYSVKRFNYEVENCFLPVSCHLVLSSLQLQVKHPAMENPVI